MAKQHQGISSDIKVGFFVCAGVVLTMAAVLVLGSNDNITSRKVHFTSHFPDVEGLINGAKVVLNGIQVGTVDDISYDPEKRDVLVKYNVVMTSAGWVREGANTQIATQGVLGDKYIALSAGDKSKEAVKDGSEIPSAPAQGIGQFLSRSDELLERVKSAVTSLDKILKSMEYNGRADAIFGGLAQTSKNMASASEKFNKEMDQLKLKAALKSLESILAKVDNGTGTLGALVNDPSLFDAAQALFGGANRNRIVRNLVRQTIKESEEKNAHAPEKK